MTRDPTRIVLGSRSPQRLELLRLIVPAERIEVVLPRSAEEPGFDGLHALPAIEGRLLQIARTKCDDVLGQLGGRQKPPAAVVAADTVIVATDDRGTPVVLGQPDGPDWPGTVRRWFREYYSGRTHLASTGLRVAVPGGGGVLDPNVVRSLRDRTVGSRSDPTTLAVERVVHSEVTFDTVADCRLDWYIATGEPKGKAGGYAVQAAGSIFVSRVEGSLSNIIGLPLEALLDAFEELHVRFD